MIRNARYRTIPCWFNLDTHELVGKNWFYNFLIDINVWLDINVFKVEEFPIWVEEDE